MGTKMAQTQSRSFRSVKLLNSLFGATQVPELNTGRYGMPAVVIGKYALVIGGSGPHGRLNDIEAVDLKSGRSESIPTKLIPRRYHRAEMYRGYVVIFGGSSDTTEDSHQVRRVEIYDPATGSIEVARPIPTPRRLSSSVIHDGKIYVFGGRSAGRRHVVPVEIYDIERDTWMRGAPMPNPREAPVALHNGLVHVVGGFNSGGAQKSVSVYDISKDAWNSYPDLTSPLSAHRLLVHGDYIFAFGDYKRLDQVSSYDTRSSSWAGIANSGYQASRHNAAVYHEGNAYIFGGNHATQGSNLKTIQVCNLDSLLRLPLLRFGSDPFAFLT